MTICLYLARFLHINVLGTFEVVVRGIRDEGMEQEDGYGRGGSKNDFRLKKTSTKKRTKFTYRRGCESHKANILKCAHIGIIEMA